MTDVVQIDFVALGYIVIALFALVGFFRGWWKEGVTTVFLVLLVVVLTQPNMLERFITVLNALLELLKPVVSITLDTSKRDVYVVLLIVLVVVSYLAGKMGLGVHAVTPLGAIMGGLLGAINGFIVTSLFKEYLLGRLPSTTTTASQITASSAQSTDTVAFQVTGLSSSSSIGSTEVLLIIVLIGIVVAVLLVSTRVEFAQTSTRWFKGKTPAGHK